MENNVIFCPGLTDTYYKEITVRYPEKTFDSFQNAVHNQHPDLNILEISTKSDTYIGRRLSALNLTCCFGSRGYYYPVENVYQASKVFENGGPYHDLLGASPAEAKTDTRLRSSGKLIGYELFGDKWKLHPSTFFYDWLYTKSLHSKRDLANEIVKYDAFTDYYYGGKNCQARAAAIYVSLHRRGELEKLSSPETFRLIYEIYEQLSLF